MSKLELKCYKKAANIYLNLGRKAYYGYLRNITEKGLTLSPNLLRMCIQLQASSKI